MGTETNQFFKEFGEPISIGATALGGILGAVGQRREGKALKAQATFQAAVLRNNKFLTDIKAKEVLEEGAIAQQQRQLQVGQIIGAQRASFAGRGVVVDEGTAFDLLLDAVRIGKLDEIAIQTNADREALALKMQGANFEIQARLAEAKGKAAKEAGLFGAAGTLLATAGKVASKWAIFNKRNEPLALRTS
mgnify:CR=1 FL=1